MAILTRETRQTNVRAVLVRMASRKNIKTKYFGPDASARGCRLSRQNRDVLFIQYESHFHSLLIFLFVCLIFDSERSHSLHIAVHILIAIVPITKKEKDVAFFLLSSINRGKSIAARRYLVIAEYFGGHVATCTVY